MCTHPAAPTTSEFVTPAQAAKLLGVTPRTIYLWINAGRLSAVRVSERVTRIPAPEIDRLLGRRSDATQVPNPGAIFWDVDAASVDVEAHARFIIERILEAGRPAHVRWMLDRYPLELALDVATHSRALSRKASVAWSTLLRERIDRAA